MQITIEIPDKLSKDLNALSDQKGEQEKIIKKALAEKLERIRKFKNDPFTKWALNKKNCFKDKNDVAVHHDKYLYGKE